MSFDIGHPLFCEKKPISTVLLTLFGLLKIIKSAPELCKALFKAISFKA